MLCLDSLTTPASENFQVVRARTDTHCHRETVLPLTASHILMSRLFNQLLQLLLDSVSSMAPTCKHSLKY